MTGSWLTANSGTLADCGELNLAEKLQIQEFARRCEEYAACLWLISSYELWIHADSMNAENVLKALASFGAPLSGLSAHDLISPGIVFQIGVPPLRIDVMTTIDGVDFVDAWPDRFQANFGEVPVFIISRQHLILNKKTSARLQDLADLEKLTEAGNE